MYGKAFAPEYQGELRTALGVNSSYEDVRAAADRSLETAAGPLERARASLALAEANRRLGRVREAGDAWRGSYRSARSAGHTGAMAWALWSGGTLARQCGSLRLARRLLGHAVTLAAESDDRLAHGRAWSLRGVADVLSVRGEPDRALALLSEAEGICRAMDLASALAYNHKMRANVLYRDGRYEAARDTYASTLAEFRALHEPRGAALCRLGLVKSRSRLGRDQRATLAELDVLDADFTRIGLRHAREMVVAFRAETARGGMRSEHREAA
ncbi:hypothetical protein [Streptomyces sp. NPDC058066]|uniref:hypothetical protein n=1 Tax=Streptomyces sp. NPDC058066 TaxID=3346323 RepID=UPI0036ECBB01